MKKARKHSVKATGWPLLLWATIWPALLALLAAGLGAAAVMQQWVPQAGAIYFSYLAATIFYLIGPLPVMKGIKRYPLPIAYGYAILWTAILACVKAMLWPDLPGGASGILWGVIAVSATLSGLLGAKLTV